MIRIKLSFLISFSIILMNPVQGLSQESCNFQEFLRRINEKTNIRFTVEDRYSVKEAKTGYRTMLRELIPQEFISKTDDPKILELLSEKLQHKFIIQPCDYSRCRSYC